MLHRVLNLLLCVSCILCQPGEIYGLDDADNLQVDPPQLVQRQGRGIDMPVNIDKSPVGVENVLENANDQNEINLEPQDAAGPQEVYSCIRSAFRIDLFGLLNFRADDIYNVIYICTLESLY